MSLEVAAGAIRRWREHPAAMVRELFQVEPDAWQVDVLEAFPHHQRQAMKACKGPGKTAVLSWLAWNFLLTRSHPKIAATSITADNLADGLWTEMARWQRVSPLLTELFTWQKTRIFASQHPETWWMSARTWPRTADAGQQADTLAGLHADSLLFLLDEAGGIPDAVMVAAEAGLANVSVEHGREAHIVIAGNPTHLSGPLYRASTADRALWHVTEITGDPDDPKRSPRVSIDYAREEIARHGRENPWVLVNVFGQFPPSSINALLGVEEVTAALGRHLPPDRYQGLPMILGVDVAREGLDRSVIFPRQGAMALPPTIVRNYDSLQGAGLVAAHWMKHKVDACFVDNTGGFGGGWVDQLRALGHRPVAVHFASAASDPRYVNRRAEMWFAMADWVKAGGALPPVQDLVGELTGAEYFFKGDRVQLVEKDQMRAKIGRSPDLADALALTFAAPVGGAAQRVVSKGKAGRALARNPWGSL